MCPNCNKRSGNVSVQILRSKYREFLETVLTKHSKLSLAGFVSLCLSGSYYRSICDRRRMDIAEEQLFRELDETSSSDEERDMLMTAQRYSIKLKIGMITDCQKTELITAMTKVGGKLEFAAIPNSNCSRKSETNTEDNTFQSNNSSQLPKRPNKNFNSKQRTKTIKLSSPRFRHKSRVKWSKHTLTASEIKDLLMN